MQSPRNAQQVSESFGHERAMQPFADAFYARRGYLIATRIGDKKRDLILQSQAGNHQSIEEKFRGAVRDDVLVEIMQDAVSGELGWLYHCQADYLHYIMCPDWQRPTLMYRLAWKPFRSWLLGDYLRRPARPSVITSMKGYGLTINVAVPYAAIPKEMKQRIQIEAEAQS